MQDAAQNSLDDATRASTDRLKRRQQLSMVLPADLIAAIKQRARDHGLSITAYVSQLLRQDLGLPQTLPDKPLGERVSALESRVDQLEQQQQPTEGKNF